MIEEIKPESPALEDKVELEEYDLVKLGEYKEKLKRYSKFYLYYYLLITLFIVADVAVFVRNGLGFYFYSSIFIAILAFGYIYMSWKGYNYLLKIKETRIIDLEEFYKKYDFEQDEVKRAYQNDYFSLSEGFLKGITRLNNDLYSLLILVIMVVALLI